MRRRGTLYELEETSWAEPPLGMGVKAQRAASIAVESDQTRDTKRWTHQVAVG